jgi:hypothetical protein
MSANKTIDMWNFLDEYFDTEVVYQHLDKSPNSNFAWYSAVTMVITTVCSLLFLVFQQLSRTKKSSNSASDSKNEIELSDSEELANEEEDEEELAELLTLSRGIVCPKPVYARELVDEKSSQLNSFKVPNIIPDNPYSVFDSCKK